MIITVREGGERFDIPLRFRAPSAVTPQPTTTSGLDMVAVERALTGEEPRPRLRILEAHLAWSLITSPQAEAPDRQIGPLLGVSDRTVVRWRDQKTRAVLGPKEAPGGGEMKDRWEDQAVCAGRDLDDFFPAGDGGKAAPSLYRAAVQVCRGCPVRVQCLRFAMRAEGSMAKATRSGVFGGMTPGERYELYQHRAKAAAA